MDLDAIEAAEKAMTPGPWEAYERGCSALGYDLDGPGNGIRGAFDLKADATGIALLRNAAPEMIARIREQDAEIARLQSAMISSNERSSTIAELRALCGQAADEYLMLWNSGTDVNDDTYDRLRAASEGNQ